MPETDADKKERVLIYLPPKTLEEVERLASIDGLNMSEIHRMIYMDGVAAYAEKINKRLVNRKLLKQVDSDSED